MTYEFIALLVVVAIFASLYGYTLWRLLRQIDVGMRLLASRSYSDFAKGEKKLAQKGADAPTVVGDGYTQVFE